MANIIKKVSIGGYIALVAAIIAIAGLITALVSCSPSGFMIVQMPLIVWFTIFTIILIVGSIVYSALRKEDIISSIALIGAGLLLMFILFNLIDGKNDVLGTVLFSDLEKGFAPAETACYVGVASMVIYIVSILTLIIGSFFRITKKEAN